MRVLRTSTRGIEAIYCGQPNEYSEEYNHTDLMVVANPVLEFDRCPDWVDRLTPADRWALQRQLHTTAEPLPWMSNPTQQQKEADTMTLYQTKEETPRFGTKLAVNTSGKYVLEMKGSGEVLVFDKNDVEEVRPYTVQATYPGSGKTGSFVAVKGSVDKGDLIILSNGTLIKITALDTKSNVTASLKGAVKLATTPLEVPDDGVDLLEEEL